MPRIGLGLAAGLAGVILGTQMWAQSTVPCVSDGMTWGINYGVGPTKNAPFTAVTKSTFEQKLADGNAIHTVSHAHQARDSAGRTMIEMPQGCERGEDGQMHPRFSMNVFDPVAKTSLNWQVGGFGPKVVRVFHQEPVVRKPPTPEELAAQAEMMKRARAQQPRNQNHTEQLGTKTINGMLATGRRITRTVLAGEEGNDLPLLIVNETWSTREGLIVMASQDDPRRGKTTFEYEEFAPGEPDPAVFTPPADYKLEERTMGGGLIEGVAGTAR